VALREFKANVWRGQAENLADSWHQFGRGRGPSSVTTYLVGKPPEAAQVGDPTING
jgi:hypothetical protein